MILSLLVLHSIRVLGIFPQTYQYLGKRNECLLAQKRWSMFYIFLLIILTNDYASYWVVQIADFWKISEAIALIDVIGCSFPTFDYSYFIDFVVWELKYFKISFNRSLILSVNLFYPVVAYYKRVFELNDFNSSGFFCPYKIYLKNLSV